MPTCPHRQIRTLVGLGLGLLMNACTLALNTTPEDTIKSTISMVRHSQLRSAPDPMTGPALEAFGSKEGLATLHEKLSKVISIDPPGLIEAHESDAGERNPGGVTKVFTARVSGLT